MNFDLRSTDDLYWINGSLKIVTSTPVNSWIKERRNQARRARTRPPTAKVNVCLPLAAASGLPPEIRILIAPTRIITKEMRPMS